MFFLISFFSAAVGAEVDPTKPFTGNKLSSLSNSNVVQEQLKLDSIIHGKNVHTAVVNGTLLKVGDTIGEYTLTKVNDKSVVLSSDDENKELTIFSQILIK